MAKRRKCKRKKVTWQGVKIALPCGSSKLTQAHKDTLDDSYTQSEWNKAKAGKCRVIFYTKNRVAMRCDRNRAKVAGQTTATRGPRAGSRKKLATIREQKGARITKKGGMEKAAEARYRRMVREGEICLKKDRFSNRC